MNTIATNTGMNIEDYEDQAVKRSKLAKGIGIAAGAAVGGAAIAAGTTYAATSTHDDDSLNEALTADELTQGAEVGEDIEPTPEPEPTPTTQYVYVEKPAPEPEPDPEPEVTWNETTNYYVGDEKVMSVETGTVDGHDFMLVDTDADEHADILAIDVNNNKTYEEDEIIRYTPADHVHMGHETAQTIENHYMPSDPWYNPYEEQYAYTGEGHNQQPYREEPIHNNFEDEKTGEEYHDDFAENNPDYNPNADVDYGNNNQYLAENYEYDGGDDQNYHAGIDGNSYDEPSVEPSADMQADADGMGGDSYDEMMDNDEFLG